MLIPSEWGVTYERGLLRIGHWHDDILVGCKEMVSSQRRLADLFAFPGKSWTISAANASGANSVSVHTTTTASIERRGFRHSCQSTLLPGNGVTALNDESVPAGS
jgi:hypothetical protein